MGKQEGQSSNPDDRAVHPGAVRSSAAHVRGGLGSRKSKRDIPRRSTSATSTASSISSTASASAPTRGSVASSITSVSKQGGLGARNAKQRALRSASNDSVGSTSVASVSNQESVRTSTTTASVKGLAARNAKHRSSLLVNSLEADDEATTTSLRVGTGILPSSGGAVEERTIAPEECQEDTVTRNGFTGTIEPPEIGYQSEDSVVVQIENEGPDESVSGGVNGTSEPTNTLPTGADDTIPEQAPVSDENLVSAKPVDEENPDLPSAEQYDQDKARERKSTAKARMRSYLLGGILLIVVITLIVVFTMKASDDTMVVVMNATEYPSTSPSMAPTMRGDSLLDLLPNDTVEAIYRAYESDDRTYQSKAYNWIMNDPNWQSYSQTRLLQRFALAAVYFGTYGEGWFTAYMVEGEPWLLDHSVHECLWSYPNITGVFRDARGDLNVLRPDSPCTENGIYESLWLPSSNLVGEIPMELFLLSSLKVLNLEENQKLSGTIPSQIGNLQKLETIVLPTQLIKGTIPKELFRCLNLTQLLLIGGERETQDQETQESLGGSLPSEFGVLQQLQALMLPGNAFSGELPSQLGLLGNLTYLDLSSNDFTGALPTEIGMGWAVQELNLESNSWNGTLPSQLATLSSLTHFSIRFNLFSGSIPSELGNLPNVKELSLAANSLTGQIPSQLGRLTTLESMLSVRANPLSGAIPSELGMLQSCGQFWIFDTQLSGSIPTEFGMLSSAQLMLLERNQLSGKIPAELGHLQAGFIMLTGNQLTGQIPSELGRLNSAYVIALDGNQLSGPIPSELGKVPFLEELSFSYNSLSGSIPPQVSGMNHLVYFAAQGNQLSGEVPVFESVINGEFGNNQWVPHKSINITGNYFSGVLPEEMCTIEDWRFAFDCSDALCGCSCACPNSTTSPVSSANNSSGF